MRWWGVAFSASFAGLAACSLLVDTSGYARGGGGGADASSAIVDGGSTGFDAATPSTFDASTCGDAGDPSLVLDLRFDEGSGTTVVDCSGRGHNGLMNGGVTWTSGRDGGAALTFDGATGCIALGAPQDLQLDSTPFTLSAWVRVTQFQMPQTGDSRPIIAKTTKPTSNGWRLVSDGVDTDGTFGTKVGRDGGTTFDVMAPGGQPLATWVHVATAWTPGASATTYVGGIQVQIGNALPPVIDAVTTIAYVGCLGPTFPQYFDGALDDVRVYRRALAPAEIAALAK